jgi:hypothetical protein
VSRYKLSPRDPNNNHLEIFVGFDNPLRTFFAQVINASLGDEDDNVILWEGAIPGEIETVEHLEEVIRNYADIPPNVKEKLTNDYNNRTEPSPLQKMAIALMSQERKKHGLG